MGFKMKKVLLDTEKLYYGFPVLLLGYKDSQHGYNYSTSSSSYTLDDLLVVGVWKHGGAFEQIKNAKYFTVNIPDESLMKEIEIGGFNSKESKFKLAPKLSYEVSSEIDAPIISNCPINLVCEVVKMVEVDPFDQYCHVFAKVKQRFVSEELIQNGDLLRHELAPVLFMGDGKKRIYRYLDVRIEELGSFSKN